MNAKIDQSKRAIVVWVILNLFTSIFLAGAIILTMQFMSNHQWCVK